MPTGRSSPIGETMNDVGSDKKSVKKVRKNHSQLGADFVAPDGGFGWLVCMAAGFSNVNDKILRNFESFNQCLHTLALHISGASTIRFAFPRTFEDSWYCIG